MAKCPNCGRDTQRTQDWACQWCGYPLVSGSFRQISKTFQEAKAERLRDLAVFEAVEAEVEAVTEAGVMSEDLAVETAEVPPSQVSEYGSEEAVEVEPAEGPEVPAEAETGSISEAALVTGLGVEAELETELEPVAEAETGSVSETLPVAEPEAIEAPEAELEAEPAPEPLKEPEAEPEPETVSEEEPAVEVEEEAAQVSEPVAEVKEEPMPNVIAITVEGLSAACRANREAADARFADSILEITGIVTKIPTTEFIERPCVILTGTEGAEVSNVLCAFGEEQASAINQLSVGQKVTVRGTYDSYTVNILLTDCVLVS